MRRVVVEVLICVESVIYFSFHLSSSAGGTYNKAGGMLHYPVLMVHVLGNAARMPRHALQSS